MAKIAMAAAAHPDDIEFAMSGTLMLLREVGYEIHYMNIANGSCGTAVFDHDEIIRMRTAEARNAAESIGAVFHEPFVDDIEVLYEQPLIRKTCAVVREVQPEILLLPSPQDYMEDHMTASRLMVTAAFCRNMRNYVCDPPTPPVDNDMCLYHAMPTGFCDQLRNLIRPDFCVDVSGVIDRKRTMLVCHRSQKEWLDESQGHDNYIHWMDGMCAEMGKMSGRFEFAEGWRRHLHLGYGPENFDPLGDALACRIVTLD